MRDLDFFFATSKNLRDCAISLITPELAMDYLSQAKFIEMPKWKKLNVANSEKVAQYYDVSIDAVEAILAENDEEFAEEWVLAASSLQDDLFETREGRDFLVCPKEFRAAHLQDVSKITWVQLAPKPKNPLVYFVLDTGNKLIKIGFSRSVDARLASLQVGNIHPLRLLGVCDGGRSEEYAFHKRFAQYKVRSEWFKDCKEIRDCIASLPPLKEKEQNKSFWTSRAMLRFSFFIKDCEVAKRIKEIVFSSQVEPYLQEKSKV